MRRLRVLVLMQAEFVPPDTISGYSAQQIHEWKTEYDVVSTLRAAGHEVHPLGVGDELKPVRVRLRAGVRSASKFFRQRPLCRQRFPRLRLPVADRTRRCRSGLLEVSYGREDFDRPIWLWDKKTVVGQFALARWCEPGHDNQVDRRPSVSNCSRQPESVH